MPEPLCEARNITKQFLQPHRSATRVLDDVTFAIFPNEVVAVVGPSGCGKSTLLRILGGVIPPGSGEVLYRGEVVTELNPRMGFVFQSPALFPWMTVLENLEAAQRPLGLRRDEVRARAQRVSEVWGLVGLERAFPHQLSPGAKQRASIACAFTHDPELVLMDEPFRQIDEVTAELLRAQLVEIWHHGDAKPRSIVIVSDDIREVVNMADRIVILGKPGRIRQIIANPLPRNIYSVELAALVSSIEEIVHAEGPDDDHGTTLALASERRVGRFSRSVSFRLADSK